MFRAAAQACSSLSEARMQVAVVKPGAQRSNVTNWLPSSPRLVTAAGQKASARWAPVLYGYGIRSRAMGAKSVAGTVGEFQHLVLII
jgi:hypothetical protein